MAIVLAFNALLLAVFLYALLKGGAPERIVACQFLVAALATLAVQQMSAQFENAEIETLVVDFLLLAGLFGVALFAQRYWPLWVTALHMIAVAVHGVKVADPALLPAIYSRAAAMASLPMILLLALGTYRHQVRLKRNGTDPSWSSSWSRSARPPAAAAPSD